MVTSFLFTDGSQVIVSRDRIQELESLCQLQKHEVSHIPQLLPRKAVWCSHSFYCFMKFVNMTINVRSLLLSD